jgi:hypothetical protein
MIKVHYGRDQVRVGVAKDFPSRDHFSVVDYHSSAIFDSTKIIRGWFRFKSIQRHWKKKSTMVQLNHTCIIMFSKIRIVLFII